MRTRIDVNHLAISQQQFTAKRDFVRLGARGSEGLFLKALASHATLLPQLISSNLGKAVASEERMARPVLAGAAPELDEESLEQITLCRFRLDPRTNPGRPADGEARGIRTANDKLPFQITPFAINLQCLGK